MSSSCNSPAGIAAVAVAVQAPFCGTAVSAVNPVVAEQVALRVCGVCQGGGAGAAANICASGAPAVAPVGPCQQGTSCPVGTVCCASGDCAINQAACAA